MAGARTNARRIARTAAIAVPLWRMRARAQARAHSQSSGAQRSRVARIEPLSWGEIGRAPKQKEKSSGLNLSNGIIACIIAILC